MKQLQFQNGDKIPTIGLGTWKSKPGEAKDAILTAVKMVIDILIVLQYMVMKKKLEKLLMSYFLTI